MTTFRKKTASTFWLQPWGSRVCLRTKYLLPCCCMCHPLHLICNMATFWKEKYLIFWDCSCVKGQNICFHGVQRSIPFNLISNMTTFRKKWFEILTQIPRCRGCVSGQNVCNHVVVCVVPFNLIIMQHDHILKKLKFGLSLSPLVNQGDWTQAFKLKSRLIWYISIVPLHARKILLNFCEI